MKVLFVDTTTADLVVALVDENSIFDFTVRNLGLKHSETLCSQVQFAMDTCGLTFADLDAYACAVGPGSFTGIRIGISTVKGYHLAAPKPLISVNCLQAIACSQKCFERGSAIIDAGNGYYFADYLNGVEPCLISYDDERVLSAGKCCSAAECLDGAVKLVREIFSARAFVEELAPVYIRKSQAEERR